MEVEKPLDLLRGRKGLSLFLANLVETARKKRGAETLGEIGVTRGECKSKPVVVAIL